MKQQNAWLKGSDLIQSWGLLPEILGWCLHQGAVQRLLREVQDQGPMQEYLSSSCHSSFHNQGSILYPVGSKSIYWSHSYPCIHILLSWATLMGQQEGHKWLVQASPFQVSIQSLWRPAEKHLPILALDSTLWGCGVLQLQMSVGVYVSVCIAYRLQPLSKTTDTWVHQVFHSVYLNRDWPVIFPQLQLLLQG